jgi:hypothetical protein
MPIVIAIVTKEDFMLVKSRIILGRHIARHYKQIDASNRFEIPRFEILHFYSRQTSLSAAVTGGVPLSFQGSAVSTEESGSLSRARWRLA